MLNSRAQGRSDPISPEDFKLIQRLLPLLDRLPFLAYIAQRQKKQVQGRVFTRKRAACLW